MGVPPRFGTIRWFPCLALRRIPRLAALIRRDRLTRVIERRHLVIASWIGLLALVVVLVLVVPSGSPVAWALIAIGGASSAIDIVKRRRARRHPDH